MSQLTGMVSLATSLSLTTCIMQATRTNVPQLLAVEVYYYG